MGLDKFISKEGYKTNSPDKNNPYNIIPSNQITMKGVPHPVYGIDDQGNGQMMMPGGEYTFGGNYVTEYPMHQMPDGTMMPGETHGEYEEMELTDEEIEEYRKGGYIVDYQSGGEYNEEVDGIPVKRVYKDDFHGSKQFALVDDRGNELAYGVDSNKPKMEAHKVRPIPRPKQNYTRADSAAVYEAGKAADDFRQKAIKEGKMTPGSKTAGDYAELFNRFNTEGNTRFGYRPDFRMLETYEDYKPDPIVRKDLPTVDKVKSKTVDVRQEPKMKRLPGIPKPPSPTITGYTQEWDPIAGKWTQQPVYETLAEPDANRYKQKGGETKRSTKEYKEAYDKGQVTRYNPNTDTYQGQDLPTFEMSAKDTRVSDAVRNTADDFAEDYVVPTLKGMASFTPAGPLIGLTDAAVAFGEGDNVGGVLGAGMEALPYGIGKAIKSFRNASKVVPDEVYKQGVDDFITRPLTRFTKNELTPGDQLYRKIGNKSGLQDLINKGGAQAPKPMKMNSGVTIDTPFFGINDKPLESYKGMFAVETPIPSKSKYNWTSRAGGTNNYGVAPHNEEGLIKNIPLEDLNVYKKKWFSNKYKKLDPNNLEEGLKYADAQYLAENAVKWGVRGAVAHDLYQDDDKDINDKIYNFYKEGVKQEGGEVYEDMELTDEEIVEMRAKGYDVYLL